MTYIYKCTREDCGESVVSRHRDFVGEECPCEAGVLVRDYRAESVGFAVGTLKRERERGGSSAIRDTFLPTAADYAGPGDPDGSKGIREWNDTHDPRPGNSKPLRPESPRKSW